MFVGHAMLAFALLAGAATLAGVDRDRAIALGVTAAAFATIPDIDILYALAGVLQVGLVNLWSAVDVFWATGNVVHRAITHSLVLGVPASVGFALATTRHGRLVGGAVLGVLVGWVLVVGGPLAGVVAAASLGAGVVVALLAAGEFDLGPRGVLAAAATGWLSHPFGDLFTGEPPAMLYPLDATLMSVRVTLHPDPTLHLLAAFGIELATIWLAAAVYVHVTGGRVRPNLDHRASLGASYAVVAVLLPAPTLSVSYHFVVSIIAVGTIGLLAGRHPWSRADDRLPAILTGLSAVTLAAGAYAIVYIVR